MQDIQDSNEASPLRSAQTHYSATDSAVADVEEGLWEKHRKAFASRVFIKPKDAMTYDIERLSSWHAFFATVGTAWHDPTLWWIMVLLLIVSAITCLLIVFWADPSTRHEESLNRISTFLNIYTGTMLSFSIASSVNRWYRCATGFLEIFDAIRSLQIHLCTLGATKERVVLVVRYGVLSVFFLAVQLETEAVNMITHCDGPERNTRIWELWESLKADLREEEEEDERTAGPRLLAMDDKERLILASVRDPASMLWMWVGSLIGRMAQDQDIPGMASPTYGRIMSLVQDANTGIRSVRAAIGILPPYVYVHMLATLVHINNILNAIVFGCCLGVTVAHRRGTWADDLRLIWNRKLWNANANQVILDFQHVLVCFLLNMFGSFLYQTLLQVTLYLSTPVSREETRLPAKKLRARLEQDLVDGFDIAEHPPQWKAPRFHP